jgi:UDP-N-acetylglucosamine 2-epimerase (non-hydrolysing)
MSYVAVITGARPNFMKVDPIIRELSRRRIPYKLIHTGQHYDKNMSEIFFEELEIAKPDVFLEVGSGSHAEQTAKVMIEFERLCMADRPSLVVVVGDVNSTLACSLVAAKLNIKLCHVEAGLRSGDWTMPEEVNRVLTDRMSDLLLTPSPDGDENLIEEGIARSKIHCVGNVMIDTLLRLLPRAQEIDVQDKFGVAPQQYALVTLHRPSNVDVEENAAMFVDVFDRLASRLSILLPLHPRTKKKLIEFGLYEALEKNDRIHLSEPIGYVDCLALNYYSRFVLTDSGGLQEETTALGVPCLTARENTERPITVVQGTNTIVGTQRVKIEEEIEKILNQSSASRSTKDLNVWDGKAAGRSVDCIEKVL